jgi:hypothetical protein
VSQQNVDIVRAGFVAFNSEDIERILDFAHPDFETAVSAELSAEPDTYRGHDGIRRYFESFRDAMEEIRFHPERFWDAGESVVVSLRLTAKGRQTAIAVEQRLAQVWTLRDGKAVGVRTYATLAEAMESAGLRD